MPDWETLYPGRFLKKSDLVGPRTIRITAVKIEALENDTGGKEDKPVINYRDAKGVGEIPWNKTNSKLTEIALGGERDYQKWVGRCITIAHDPSIMFGAEQKGGIRVVGSPELKQGQRVKIKLPRRKKPEVYELYPTNMRGELVKPATTPAPDADQEPGAGQEPSADQPSDGADQGAAR